MSISKFRECDLIWKTGGNYVRDPKKRSSSIIRMGPISNTCLYKGHRGTDTEEKVM